jgi:flagellar hook protein FlgE
MGIFDALTNAVTGLQAQSFALQNISGNIANSQTTAFKRVDTSFSDLVPESAPSQQVSGGVIAQSRATNTVQGAIQAASVDTYMGINGDGYFIVQKPVGFPAGTPVFGGNNLYTRRGDFQLDKNGFLVNGAGYYLEGLSIDPTTGNVTGSGATVLKVSNDLIPAQVTTTIQYRANLASLPLTAHYSTTVPNSELLNPADFTTDPTVAGTGTVTGADTQTFLNESIAGGAVTVFDPQGNPVDVQLRWAKIDSIPNGGTDTWELFYQTDSTAVGAAVAWNNAGVDYKFDPNGQMNPSVPSVALTALTVDGHLVGDVTINHGANGMTQFADTNGVAQVNTLTQNGFAAGTLNSIAVNDKGRIVATYSNGRTVDIAEIPLVTFKGQNALKSLDGGAFAATDDSGPAIFGASGTIAPKSLEGSNTDIADEFTKLIVTQQAYAANTKIVTTAQQMLQDTLNMLR